ncbi:Ig-like domain-containing protein [Pontiellaceae bacterium B1224]|nr:Ig-like domain-containing protein [Pontiellaceae bacterium B1224]
MIIGFAQAEVLYLDHFDNDTLAVNTGGIGGGAVNNTIYGHSWTDDGDASFSENGTQFTRRALLYSDNAFQSDEGFSLTVYYTAGAVVDTAAHTLSFGLISTDTDLSAYSGYNPFGSDEGVATNVYSLGASVVAAVEHGNLQGLNFTDGSSRINLDSSGDNVQFVAEVSTPVVILIGPDGAWSYSIDGIEEASGVIAGGFDLTKSYHVAVYGQDDQSYKSVQSITLMTLAVSNSAYYVSTTGNDTNSGTFAEPFATIQHAVDTMSPGDTCYIRGGSYHESVDLSGVAGAEGFPITLAAYENEIAVLDGRVKIETAWMLEERASVSLPEGNNTPTNNIPGIGNVYVTTLDESIGDITQLFVEEKSMTLARWPNTLAFSDEVFFGAGRTLKSSAVHGEATDLASPYSLVDLGVSIKDCMGLFGSVRRVTAHHAGEADFSHNKPATLESGTKWYFLEGGLDNAERVLLDSEQEWAYDESTGKLTFWPENDVDPNGLSMYARNMMDAFSGDAGTKHIVIDGLDFFASKFDFDSSDHITIQNCDFTYYAISERALGARENAKIADFTGSKTDFCENITVYNCAFRYADGTGFSANYVDGLTFENNLLYKTAYYVCGEWDEYNQRRATHAYHSYNTKNTLYRRNTVDTTGSNQSIAFSRYGTSSPEYPIVAEYNFTTRCCNLGTDVSAMYIPEEDVHESVARFNWFVDNNRRDFRWDGGNFNEVKTANGNFYRNVGKQGTSPVKHGYHLKGDFHEIYNSITIGDSWKLNVPLSNGGNTNSVSRNNAADLFGAILEGDGFDWDIPGDDANNYVPDYSGQRSMHELLRDPDNWDFRPRADAVELVDQGVSVTCTVNGVEIDVTAGYLGAAPDIGVYEYGEANYWIPGRQEKQASRPIPLDGSTNAMHDCDLMWLGGLNAVSYNIYLGTAPNSLALAASQTNNIFNPGVWTNDQTYFWRIDSVLADSSVVEGDVWTFAINDHAPRADSIHEVLTEDGATDFELTGSDIDGDALSFTVITEPLYGTLSGTAPYLAYTPDPDYFGPDFLQFKAGDGSLDSDSAVVMFSVEGVDDDAPYFYEDPINLRTVNKGLFYTSSIAASATDPDKGVLTFSKLSGPSWLHIAEDGAISGIPEFADIGQNRWVIEVTDPTGLNATATMEVNVTEGEVVALNFEDLNISVNSNSLTAGGSSSNLTVAGFADGDDYLYSVVYTGTDLDGDLANDTLTFDVRVRGWSGGTTDAGIDEPGSAYTGSAAIGTMASTISFADSTFTVGGAAMDNGEILEFLLENIGVVLTDAGMTGIVVSLRFTSARLEQTSSTGNSHQAVFGSGTGLLGIDFDTNAESGPLDVGTGSLYISSDSGDGIRSTSWGVAHVDFGIEIWVLPSGSYTLWASGYGLSGEDRSPSADPENGGDGDGYNNLAEYALGMNPTNLDADSGESVGVVAENGTNWFEIVHYRRSDYVEQGLSYLLIDSTNLLGSVVYTNAQDQILVGPSVDGYEPVTNRYETDEPGTFIELRIQQN